MPDQQRQIVAAEGRQLSGKLARPSNRGWRTTAIVASLVVALGLACCAVAAPAPRTSAEPPAVVHPLQRSVLKQLNAVRRQHGLLPLQVAAGLAAAAREHSLEMARLGYFSQPPFGRAASPLLPRWALGKAVRRFRGLHAVGFPGAGPRFVARWDRWRRGTSPGGSASELDVDRCD